MDRVTSIPDLAVESACVNAQRQRHGSDAPSADAPGFTLTAKSCPSHFSGKALSHVGHPPAFAEQSARHNMCHFSPDESMFGERDSVPASIGTQGLSTMGRSNFPSVAAMELHLGGSRLGVMQSLREESMPIAIGRDCTTTPSFRVLPATPVPVVRTTVDDLSMSLQAPYEGESGSDAEQLEETEEDEAADSTTDIFSIYSDSPEADAPVQSRRGSFSSSPLGEVAALVTGSRDGTQDESLTCFTAHFSVNETDATDGTDSNPSTRSSSYFRAPRERTLEPPRWFHAAIAGDFPSTPVGTSLYTCSDFGRTGTPSAGDCARRSSEGDVLTIATPPPRHLDPADPVSGFPTPQDASLAAATPGAAAPLPRWPSSENSNAANDDSPRRGPSQPGPPRREEADVIPSPPSGGQRQTAMPVAPSSHPSSPSPRSRVSGDTASSFEFTDSPLYRLSLRDTFLG